MTTIPLVLASMFASAANAVVPPVPTVEGPITGPGIPHPGVRGPLTGFTYNDPLPPDTLAAANGYIEDEYFISGVGDNGNAYKTRIVVRRPADVARFSGLVVAEVLHPEGTALLWQGGRIGLMKNGDVAVEIDSSTGNLNSIRSVNAERYASLSIGSGVGNDIIAQTGRLLKSTFPEGPAWDAKLKAVVLGGCSATAATANAFFAAYHNNHRMPDGGPIYDGLILYCNATNLTTVGYDVPIVQVPTQTELNGANTAFRARQDSDTPGFMYRRYEMTGMSHIETRESPATDPAGCNQQPISTFMYNALMFGALDHILDWAGNGITPPHMTSGMVRIPATRSSTGPG